MKETENSRRRILQTFAHSSEGSDAESEFEWKCCGVPPWEIQPECTDELTGRALFEHETPGMLL
jgi:hypothetical protein